VTPADRRERELEAIREAGRRRARRSPPLTAQQIEELAFLLAPTYAALPRTTQAEPLPAAA
jgi:hypothetical protein